MTSGDSVRSTTVLAVVRDGAIAMAADGQVTLGDTVMKASAEKVRRIAKNRALVGFAGGAADALTLLERLEAKLETYPGNVRRASVELARDWRTDRMLRRLEATMLVGDAQSLLVVSGNGLRRGLCSFRRPGVVAPHSVDSGRGRPGSAADRRRNLHLHQ